MKASLLSVVSPNALTPADLPTQQSKEVIIIRYYQRSMLSFYFRARLPSGLSGVPDIGVAVNEGNTQS